MSHGPDASQQRPDGRSEDWARSPGVGGERSRRIQCRKARIWREVVPPAQTCMVLPKLVLPSRPTPGLSGSRRFARPGTWHKIPIWIVRRPDTSSGPAFAQGGPSALAAFADASPSERLRIPSASPGVAGHLRPEQGPPRDFHEVGLAEAPADVAQVVLAERGPVDMAVQTHDVQQVASGLSSVWRALHASLAILASAI